MDESDVIGLMRELEVKLKDIEPNKISQIVRDHFETKLES